VPSIDGGQFDHAIAQPQFIAGDIVGDSMLPTVWIPSADLRDLRELTRTRLMLSAQRTRLKNRLTATLAKYGRQHSEFTDAYGPRARTELRQRLEVLPTQTRFVSELLWQQLDFVQQQIQTIEQRLQELVQITPEMQWLQTLPGIGVILAATIALELGQIDRFASAAHLASYAGTTPRVHASGDKTRFGALRTDINQYLKWAFAEAGNSVALYHQRRPQPTPFQPVVSARAAAQGPWQSHWRRRPPPGRGDVLPVESAGSVSRADRRSIQGSVSATPS
jgi:transposase